MSAPNRRSKHITEGVARAPNRSMYYAMGYTEKDFGKPMVGVANGHSTITPCNSGLQRLADAAVEGLKAAGANPQIFGTPTISDGMAMGTEGMKYSLVSREVIADCVETCVGGQWMDGVITIGGCDKNMPGAMMGMLRANVPGIFVYGGTSGGVVAAVQAAKMGKSLLLIEPGRHLGGLTAGGLGATDIGNKAAIGGLSREFYRKLGAHYARPDAWTWQKREEYRSRRKGNATEMWTFEPHVAEQTYRDWLAEYHIPVRFEERLDLKQGVVQTGSHIDEIVLARQSTACRRKTRCITSSSSRSTRTSNRVTLQAACCPAFAKTVRGKRARGIAGCRRIVSACARRTSRKTAFPGRSRRITTR
mgnify:CR=1 FL=1